MKLQNLAGAMAMAVSLVGASMAHAATVLTWTNANTGVAKVVDFNGYEDGLIAGLNAEITYTLSSVTNGGKTWNFAYQVENISSAPVTASRISGFGFNVDPNVSGSSATGTYTHTASGNVPMLGSREVCITGNNCAGGASGGVTFGNTGSGTFRLNFGSSKSSLALSDLYVRYQSVNAPGVTGGSAVGVPTILPPGGVPEPATWAMMLTGFFAVGATLRSARRQTVAA
ncbi:MAG TPA: cistern family PEP-CTERM protein [Phenylobacterium sp.]|nr:cistern family PEP-CTERM protein [Phenylobacterium sp.]